MPALLALSFGCRVYCYTSYTQDSSVWDKYPFLHLPFHVSVHLVNISVSIKYWPNYSTTTASIRRSIHPKSLLDHSLHIHPSWTHHHTFTKKSNTYLTPAGLSFCRIFMKSSYTAQLDTESIGKMRLYESMPWSTTSGSKMLGLNIKHWDVTSSMPVTVPCIDQMTDRFTDNWETLLTLPSVMYFALILTWRSPTSSSWEIRSCGRPADLLPTVIQGYRRNNK